MYDATKHDAFARRMTNWMRQIWALREEANRLTAIYQQEAEYGAHASFTDTSIATEQELVDAIVFQSSYNALIDGSAAITQTNRTSNVTPFLAGE
jgi:hypothetical protein